MTAGFAHTTHTTWYQVPGTVTKCVIAPPPYDTKIGSLHTEHKIHALLLLGPTSYDKRLIYGQPAIAHLSL